MAKDVDGLPYVGLALCYEELTIGRRFRTIGRTVTEADIVSVINRTGMAEVLFMNLDFLIRESDIKGRVAPGAFGHTFAGAGHYAAHRLCLPRHGPEDREPALR